MESGTNVIDININTKVTMIMNVFGSWVNIAVTSYFPVIFCVSLFPSAVLDIYLFIASTDLLLIWLINSTDISQHKSYKLVW
jgi:hypothetical protein